MSVNNMSFEQSAALLNAVHEQVTGQTQAAPIDESSFVSVATTMRKAGYDPIIAAIGQVVGRTIFSQRAYYGKFKSIMMDNQQWGSVTRKLAVVDKDFEDSAEFMLVDGEAIDHYKVNKPEILQTNFYGSNVFQKSLTTFRDQLDNAMRSSAEWGSFLAMVAQNMADMIEQNNETMKRMTLANFVGGKIAADNGVIHLLTEYKEATGLDLDATTVMQPANYPAFIQWVYARIEQLSNLMTERSQKFQINVEGKAIQRHTPRADQRVYLNSLALAEINARVLADTYHENFLRFATTEGVNYWQAIDNPYSLSVVPSYMDTTGEIITATEPVETDCLFGVIFDRDALGLTIFNQVTATTPMNARGLYFNTWYSWQIRWFNDFSEKGIVLLLD